MTKWVLSLNQLTPELAAKLPPTDTRFRPDLQFLERGIYAKVRCTPRQLKRRVSDLEPLLDVTGTCKCTPTYVQGALLCSCSFSMPPRGLCLPESTL